MPNTYLKKYLTVQENLIRNIKVNSIVNIYKSLAKTSKKNKVFVFGNGGSAAVASHFALDLVTQILNVYIFRYANDDLSFK